jgi:ribonuclease HI
VRLLYPDGMVQEFGAGESTTTNNRMELQAALVALEQLRGYTRATIYTDSRYLIEGVTKWIHNWRRRDWVTTAGTPVKNRVLWQRLVALNHRGITWRHVYGHTGDPNNERVDDIARGFASGTAPLLFHGPAGAPDDPVRDVEPRPSVAPSRRKPARSTRNARYISIVHGAVAIDDEWAACAARVRGVSGAKYKKVHSSEELAEFCAKHGIDVPPER